MAAEKNVGITMFNIIFNAFIRIFNIILVSILFFVNVCIYFVCVCREHGAMSVKPGIFLPRPFFIALGKTW